MEIRTEGGGSEAGHGSWDRAKLESRLSSRLWGPFGHSSAGLIVAVLKWSALPLSLFILSAISYSSNRQNI